jgi:hypothetical protein
MRAGQPPQSINCGLHLPLNDRPTRAFIVKPYRIEVLVDDLLKTSIIALTGWGQEQDKQRALKEALKQNAAAAILAHPQPTRAPHRDKSDHGVASPRVGP